MQCSKNKNYDIREISSTCTKGKYWKIEEIKVNKKKLKTRIVSILVLVCLITSTFVVPVSAKTGWYNDRTEKRHQTEYGEKEQKEQYEYGDTEIKSEKYSDDDRMFRFIDKDDFDKMGHKNRRNDLESLNTYVFDNEDGTRTIYMMKENVKYMDGNGDVREKDITLKRKDKGYTLSESDVELSLPDSPADGIDVGFSGYTIKLTPQGGIEDAEATTSDNSVVYKGYFGAETSLKYTPLLSGIKEDIVLSSYVDDASYDFILETDGLFLYNDEEGYYLADKVKKDVTFYLGDVVVYDAIGKPSDGTMSVLTIEEGERYLLTISADDKFLSDSETVYPVTIDPTITISDSATGSGSIQDAPIFSGYPTRNFGTYVYNRVGTPSSAYGVGRTVVKLTGLLNSTEYKSISANQIKSVIFYAKEASGSAAQYINLYPLTSNTTWTESTVTWNNVGSYTTSLNCGASMSYERVAQFDITNMVRAWKSNDLKANAGFIMINSNEAKNKSFYSAESSTANCPYVKMTYTTAISLNTTKVSIVEGGTYRLTATTSPSGKTVTWKTSNGNVATVSSTGLVTAKKAGSTTITASFVDADGNTKTATATVYVYVPNGVYYIQNVQSGLYLNASNGHISNGTKAIQYTKYSDSASVQYKLRQMWKVQYLDDGRYSVRPMHKLDMGLDVTETNVDIWSIGTKDTRAAVADYAEWSIRWMSNGYVFMNNDSGAKTMMIPSGSTASGTGVVTSTYAGTNNFMWTLTKVTSVPSGVLLYDTASKTIVSRASEQVDIGEVATLASFKLAPTVYSGSSIIQSFYWNSSNRNVATVNSSTGEVTGISEGKTTIIGQAYRDGKYYYVYIDVCVGYPELFDTLIDSGCITVSTCDSTGDGFYLSTTSLYKILYKKHIYSLPMDAQGTNIRPVANYYDDWYLYAVEDGETVTYGLYKMREIESDGYDGDNPGVTVSFIELDRDALLECFSSNTVVNRYNLLQALDKVTGPGKQTHNDILVKYFNSHYNDGGYLIAEKYVAFISSFTKNGELKVHKILKSGIGRLDRVLEALEQRNTSFGKTIYDFENNVIYIENVNNLQWYEKVTILACFTSNVSFNSFAAEIDSHAEFIGVGEMVETVKKIISEKKILNIYESSIRADMSITDEEGYADLYDPYYDLSSSIVQWHINAHGYY